jgi:hypothetical protein
MKTYVVEMKPMGSSTVEDIAETLPTDMKWEIGEKTGEYDNILVTVDVDQEEKLANWLGIEIEQLAEYEQQQEK